MTLADIQEMAETECWDSEPVQRTRQTVRACTQSNDHNGAIVALAELVGCERSLAIMSVIVADHKRFGSMCEPMLSVRDTVRRHLLSELRDTDPQAANLIGDEF